MDAKITLSFDKEVIEKAKKFADRQNISLSRLTELLLSKVTSGHYSSLENLPVSAWVQEVAEGVAEYKTTTLSRKRLKADYFKSRR